MSDATATPASVHVSDGAESAPVVPLADDPRPLVYVAGPYTTPDPVLNTRAACFVADKLDSMGAAVVVPHLSLLWHAISPAPINTWYERDLFVLRRCDAVVRIPGASTGADGECRAAGKWGIPIFPWSDEDASELVAWIDEWMTARGAA